MEHITRQELLKIAHLSNLEIHDDEIPALLKQIDDVLTYAQCVKEYARSYDQELEHTGNRNVFREDVVAPYNADALVEEFPERQERYIVVPAILESTK